jgi:hypothetical protein
MEIIIPIKAARAKCTAPRRKNKDLHTEENKMERTRQ